MTAMYLVLAVLLVLPGSGRESPGIQKWLNLIEAEARWKARQPAVYEFSLDVRCECLRPSGVPSRFRVTRGEPEPLPDLETTARQFYDAYNTVEKLFAIIRRPIDSGAHRLVVKYDAEFGYPLWADLDPRQEVKDDELFFRVTGFRPAGGPACRGRAPFSDMTTRSAHARSRR